MSKLIERTSEVQDAIDACEAVGDFEQAGYLAAPALKKHTGNTLEQMLVVCDAMLRCDIPQDYVLRTNGVVRWINEQLEQQQ